MTEQYKVELLEFYDLKKEKNQLADNLRNLRRSNLRRGCLEFFTVKNTRKDHEIIKAFFDPLGKFNDPIKSIEKVELDRFRPLITFLKKETILRDEASIKLIAWLIGFDSYQEWGFKKGIIQAERDDSGGEGNGDEEEEAGDEHGDKSTDEDDENGKSDTDGKNGPADPPDFLHRILYITIGQPFSLKKTIFSCAVLLLCSTGIFLLLKKMNAETIRQPTAEEKCMYWTGTHYEPVKCDEKIENVTIIPINLQALNNLKKIDLTDTLTSYSLGKVWYSKIDGKHEFFTDSGTHPVNHYKKLKPLSKYILSNYVSYYRYLLTCLKWSAAAIIGIGLFTVCLLCFLRKQKRLSSGS